MEYQTQHRPIPEPMQRLSALGYTLGRNPDDNPHNIKPTQSLWNAPDGREITYSAAKEEARFTQAFLVYYLVSGDYHLSSIHRSDTCTPAVFPDKQAALLFVQQLIVGKQSVSRQFLIDGPGVDYHIPNDAQGLKDMQYHLPHALRSKEKV